MGHDSFPRGRALPRRGRPRYSDRCWRAEPLEPRTLLAFAPIGPEFLVSAVGYEPPPGSQALSARLNPSVAADGDGDFVIAWESAGPPGIYAQRYAANGVRLGAEFKVNTTTGGLQENPSVAMDADGDFVIAWLQQGGTIGGIFFQRYNADGTTAGPESSRVEGLGGPPKVAMDADGDFVVLGARGRLTVQRFDALGHSVGAPIPIINVLLGVLDPATVAMDTAGNFVVAWADSVRVQAQRYDAAGNSVGPTVTVNSTTSGTAAYASVGMAGGGKFVIVWNGSGAADSDGIYARLYNVDGTAAGGEIAVDDDAGDRPRQPVVAMDAAGGFMASWTELGTSILSRRFTAAGSPAGPQFPITTTTAGTLIQPALAVNGDGDSVAAWTQRLYAGSAANATLYRAVRGQRFDESADTTGPLFGGLTIDGEPVRRSLPFSGVGSRLVASFSELLSVVGGTAGVVSPSNRANWKLTRDGTDISSTIQSVSFGFNPVTRKYEAVLPLSSPIVAAGNYVLTAKGTLRDPAGNALDGDRDGRPGGGDHAFAFQVANQPPTTLEIRPVNVVEDETPTTISLDEVFLDANEPSANLQYAVTSDTNPALFSAVTVDNAAGTLTLSYAPDASGVADLTVRATDSGGLGVSTTFRVTVGAGNDPPVNHVPGPQSVVQNTSLVFSAANGNAISVADDAAETTPDGEVVVTLRSERGVTLQPGTTAGVRVFSDAPEMIAISGPLSAVNAALDGLRLTPAANFTGALTLTVITDDQGHNGGGPPLADTDVINISVDRNLTPAFAINDVTVTEGDSGTTDATFTVTLGVASTRPLTVDYATTGGTATSFPSGAAANSVLDAGFEAPGVNAGTYTAGQTFGAWTVESGSVNAVQGYQTPDGSQQVLDLNAGGPGAVCQDVTTVAGQPYTLRFALAGNPAGPQGLRQVLVSFDGVPLATESFDTTGRSAADMGWASRSYTVVPTTTVSRLRFASLTPGAAGPVIDSVSLVGIGDFERASGTLTFPAGTVSRTITVPVNGDTQDERDETFIVSLSNPAGGAVPITRGSGTGTILDDDAPPTVSIGDASVVEGNSGDVAMTFTLTLSAPSGKALAVSLSSTDGTAQAGVDYAGPVGSVVFVPGQTSRTVTVFVHGDTAPEADETFFVHLSSPFEVSVGDGTGVGTIVNDDGALLGPRVTQVFVSGSAWTQEFRNYLEAQGQGDSTLGYAVPSGAGGKGQLGVLPWGNLDRLTVQFDGPVIVARDDLALLGVNGKKYGFADFAYDPAAHAATWTLPRAVRDDRLLLVLDGGLGGVIGMKKPGPLDGEWENGSSAYPSGDGEAGGDFRFQLNVLAGDADRNEVVGIGDVLQERQRRLRSIETPGSGRSVYDALHDLDGDGTISDRDLAVVRANYSSALPPRDPANLTAAAEAPPVLPPALVAAMRARSARSSPAAAGVPAAELFGTTPVL